MRRAHEVFGQGDFTELESTNEVFAFARSQGTTRVLSFNNLTEWPQLAAVQLEGMEGRTPVVLSGSVGEAPEVISSTYQIELPPYGYVWLLFADPPPVAAPRG